MTAIVRKRCPATPFGIGPNDNRHQPGYLNELDAPDPFGWTETFTLSDTQIQELKKPDWIIRNLVIRGHLIIVVGEPNAGKTAIFAHLAGEMVSAGYRVYYVNADISGSDAAEFVKQSRDGGWAAMLPDLQSGLSVRSVLDNLKAMNESGQDLSGAVFIFDTLKKMTDVISKPQVKELLRLFRSLTGKGMTVILLGHTNKYRDKDGRPIYEGTGDIRSDADELIYLIPKKNADGSLTVSTEPDKKRGDHKPITFEINPERRVRLSDSYVDTAGARKAQAEFWRNKESIDTVRDVIAHGKVIQKDIIDECRQRGFGAPTARKILTRYSREPYKQWDKIKRPEENNAWVFSLINVGGRKT